MLTSDELRATYGEGHIDKAAERGAIGTLLISDGLFRYARILALRQSVLCFIMRPPIDIWFSTIIFFVHRKTHRNSDPIRRKKFIELTEVVKRYGGTVLVFSSMHASGASCVLCIHVEPACLKSTPAN